MNIEIGHFIAGTATLDKCDRFTEVFNPALGSVVARCALAGPEEVARAAEAARKAGKEWGSASQNLRRDVLFNMRELVLRNSERLVEAVCTEQGKTRRNAIAEIGRSLQSIEYAATASELMKGEFSVNIGGNIDNFSICQPVGTVGCIAAFNHPVLVPLLMGAMAVACGNSVILKPSEKVPSSALLLAELWKEAGLPNGIWNVVNGDKETVDAILQHPDIAAVIFVGSSGVGEYVYLEGTRHQKRVACFTSGKNHMVVMPDADLEFAADSFIAGAYGESGQRCMAVSVLVPIGEGVGDALAEKVAHRAGKLRPGHYSDERADFGPVISRQSQENILKSVTECVADGATLMVDGRGYSVEGYENGFFVGATLLDHVDLGSRFYRDEVFGPARAIIRCASLDESIEIINKHTYGNGAAIFTRDGGAARRFYENVSAGSVGVNVSIPVPAGTHDFAGFKKSSYGNGFLFGPGAVRFLTKQKTIVSRWTTDDKSDIFTTSLQ